MPSWMANGTCFVFILLLLENVHVQGFGGRSFTHDELEQQHKILNKPYVKSFKIGDNDIDTFDCVNIYQQPSLSHPLLKGHKIQMSPSDVPMMDHDKSGYSGEDVEFGNLTQTCPIGTVPIRRMTKEELTMGQMLMKNLNEDYRSQFSVVTTKDVIPYYGVYAEMNVPSLNVTESGKFSGATLSVQCTKGDEANNVAVGWMIYKDLYRDTQPRLTTSWNIFRQDNFIGGCYNILCPGFVQVHRSIAPGLPLTSSTYGGVQHKVKFLIYKDHSDGNWWLMFGNKNEKIGYWPKTLFTTLQDSGDMVGWGGQVASPAGEPSLPMGSGHFAKEGYRKAAYFKNLQFLDEKLHRHQPQWDQLDRIVTTPKCYTLAPFGSNGIFYGGPGGNCFT